MIRLIVRANFAVGIAEILEEMCHSGLLIVPGYLAVMVPRDREDVTPVGCVLSIELSVIDRRLIFRGRVLGIFVLIRDIPEVKQ